MSWKRRNCIDLPHFSEHMILGKAFIYVSPGFLEWYIERKIDIAHNHYQSKRWQLVDHRW